MFQNYPNPFNPTTTIKYHLPQAGKVRIDIFNILGQRVNTLVNKQQEAGKFIIQWDGRDHFGSRAASGLYIYRIKVEAVNKTFMKARKMILLK